MEVLVLLMACTCVYYDNWPVIQSVNVIHQSCIIFDSTPPSCNSICVNGGTCEEWWQVYQSINQSVWINQSNNQSINQHQSPLSQRIESINVIHQPCIHVWFNSTKLWSPLREWGYLWGWPVYMFMHDRFINQSFNQSTKQSISQRIESIKVIHQSYINVWFYSSKLWLPLREWGYLWGGPVHVHDRFINQTINPSKSWINHSNPSIMFDSTAPSCDHPCMNGGTCEEGQCMTGLSTKQ